VLPERGGAARSGGVGKSGAVVGDWRMEGEERMCAAPWMGGVVGDGGKMRRGERRNQLEKIVEEWKREGKIYFGGKSITAGPYHEPVVIRRLRYTAL